MNIGETREVGPARIPADTSKDHQVALKIYEGLSFHDQEEVKRLAEIFNEKDRIAKRDISAQEIKDNFVRAVLHFSHEAPGKKLAAEKKALRGPHKGEEISA